MCRRTKAITSEKVASVFLYHAQVRTVSVLLFNNSKAVRTTTENIPNSAGVVRAISDDMVLDRETGLIWARNANLPDMVKRWIGAIRCCRNLTLGNRKGWRLPSIEELSSLVDPRQGYPALPKGHPFKNVGITYCTDTTDASNSDKILYVRMTTGTVHSFSKSDLFYVWPVRGGKGQSKMK